MAGPWGTGEGELRSGQRQRGVPARFALSFFQDDRTLAPRAPASPPHGHATAGGMDERIESTLPPVFRPNSVPRS